MVSFCEAVFLSFGAALKKLRCEQLVLNRFKKGIGNRANGEEKTNTLLNKEFEKRKQNGFGHFVYDKNGNVSGVVISYL